MDTKGEMGHRMNLKIEIDVSTLLILRIREINNENLLYSTGRSSQCAV